MNLRLDPNTTSKTQRFRPSERRRDVDTQEYFSYIKGRTPSLPSEQEPVQSKLKGSHPQLTLDQSLRFYCRIFVSLSLPLH